MRLKTILAKNIPEAMRRVREQLGDDAVIVQTEETDGGVLVMAAAESSPVASRAETAHGPTAGADDPWHELPLDPAEMLSEALDYHRVLAPIRGTLLSASETWDNDDTVAALSGALRARVAFRPMEFGNAPRPILLVGPAGGGKTITAAKLATLAVLARSTPALICADTQRAGGPEQLGAFAAALKLDMLRAANDSGLHDAVIAAGASCPIIIDSAALNPLDPSSARRVAEMVSAANAEPVLVLPAGLDSAEAQDLACACKDLGVERFIATRMDATRRLGAILSCAIGADLAIAAYGVSPKIVDGLRPADPDSLARALLSEVTSKMSPAATDRSQAIR